MRKELFQPTIESEARILLLIDGFTTRVNSLEGRTKLAKLDFLLRYPHFMQRALLIREPDSAMVVSHEEEQNIESRMIRYRYGPWDPSYYAVLGRLIGKGLVQPVPAQYGIGYRATEQGQNLAKIIVEEESWQETRNRVKLLKKHFNLSGNSLKKFISSYT